MLNTVKKTTFPNLFDLLAPHSCRGCGLIGNALCGRCKKYILDHHQNLCPSCKSLSPTGKCPKCQTSIPPAYVVGERSGLLGQIVHAYKYESIHSLAAPLAELLIKVTPHFNGDVKIVPLPTISSHIRIRGLDHTFLLAKHFSKHHPNYQVEKLLLRNSNSVQVGSSKSVRKKQASSAYSLNPKHSIDPKSTYLLLDDVWTTGASFLSATKKLREAGAKNIVLLILSLSRVD